MATKRRRQTRLRLSYGHARARNARINSVLPGAARSHVTTTANRYNAANANTGGGNGNDYADAYCLADACDFPNSDAGTRPYCSPDSDVRPGADGNPDTRSTNA